MGLENLQNTMLNYLSENKLFKYIMPFSALSTVIYGIYSVLININFLHTIVGLFLPISGIIYLISILGLIISFAKNDMLPIMALFLLLGISNLITVAGTIINGYAVFRLTVQTIIYILIYFYFAYTAMVRYNHTKNNN